MKKQFKLLLVTFLCGALGHTADAATFDVSYYGAVSDSTVLSTEAFQRAIDDCANFGGGLVNVPAGNYCISTIVLKSNIELHLEAGARIFATRNAAEYDKFNYSHGAADMTVAQTMIYAQDASNIAVTGLGELNARAVREQYRRAPKTDRNDSITGREILNAIHYGVDYQTKFRKVPPCPGIIYFKNCKDVRIADASFIESSGWGVHLLWCDRVTVSNVRIMSNQDNGVNSDGLDIDGCSNVTVTGCYIWTGDDAICMKTTATDGTPRPCRNITVSNCILSSSSSALKLGTESHADFENIVATGCVIDNAGRGINITLRDGGSARNILFADMVINCVRHAAFWWGNGDPIWLTCQRRKEAPKCGGIYNVSFANIVAVGQTGIRFEGFDGPIKDVKLDNVTLTLVAEPAVDKRVRNAMLFDKVDGLTLNSSEIRWDAPVPEPTWESAIMLRDVNDVEAEGIKAPAAPNGRYPAVRAERTHLPDALKRLTKVTAKAQAVRPNVKSGNLSGQPHVMARATGGAKQPAKAPAKQGTRDVGKAPAKPATTKK